MNLSLKILPCEYERYILRIKNDFFVVNSLEDLYTKFKEKQLGEGNYIKHDTPVNKNICAIFEKLKESPTAEDGTRYVTEILSLLAHRTQLISQKRIPNPLIRQIILYINSHSAEDISLETIAQKFYISKSHLTRIFKEYTNTTINQYISAERLNMARQNVRYRGMSHKDAAIAAGFKDYSSYYRAYKGKYGVSPGESDSCLNFI